MGLGVGTGVGIGVGAGVGAGVGLGVGTGVGLGVGVGLVGDPGLASQLQYHCVFVHGEYFFVYPSAHFLKAVVSYHEP